TSASPAPQPIPLRGRTSEVQRVHFPEGPMTRLMLLATVIVVAANAYAASWQAVPPSTFTDTFAPMFTARCKQSPPNQAHGSTADLVYTCAEGWIVSHYTDAQIN